VTRDGARVAAIAAALATALGTFAAPAAPAAAPSGDPVRPAARPKELPAAVAAHCRARAAISTLRASFEQVRVLSAIGEEERSRGVVSYRKPDALRWEYQAPDRSWTVMNGAEGWAVFPDIRQVHRFAIDSTRRDGVLAIVGFGACGEEFADAFDFAVSPAPGGATLVTMTPLRPALAASIARVELTIDPRDHLPRRIVLQEPAGDSIRIELRDLQKGARLDRTLFEWNLPEGYTVVR
jgi:outer membrane lipoprotein carrier protein